MCIHALPAYSPKATPFHSAWTKDSKVRAPLLDFRTAETVIHIDVRLFFTINQSPITVTTWQCTRTQLQRVIVMTTNTYDLQL
jgi:hypothetical protein